MQLRSKTRMILAAIAEGQSYDQILSRNPEWRYQDIFEAAAEALKLSNSSYDERMGETKQKCPRAYAPWDAAEDTRLRQLVAAGKRASEIAALLQRQPSAVKSRLAKLSSKLLRYERRKVTDP